MARFFGKTKMDALPSKDSSFLEEAVETLPDSSKYGWSPSPMDASPTAESPLERDSFSERKNLLLERRKIGILDGLLKEAAN